MDDEWYWREFDKPDSHELPLKEWEIFTISQNQSDIAPRIQQLQFDGVGEWIRRRQEIDYPGNGTSAGIDLLITRYKHVRSVNAQDQWLWVPVSRAFLKQVFKGLGLSPEYVYYRRSGQGSGLYQTTTIKDDDGKLQKLNLLLRPPFSSAGDLTSIWSMALSWNAQTGQTTAFFDCGHPFEKDEIVNYIRGHQKSLSHPLALPLMILRQKIMFINDQFRRPNDRAFFDIEQDANLSRIDLQNSAWNWTPEQFRNATDKANIYRTLLYHLERHTHFLIHFAKFLLKYLADIDKYDLAPGLKKQLAVESEAMRESLCNLTNLLENQEHNILCMQKRAENFTNVLYTIVTQKDTQTNLRIALAVRHDSVSMRTIAYLTLFFLPATFVSALFGMNFFLFDVDTRTVIVAKTFWQYWATTIPLTLVVLALWKIYIRWEQQQNVVKDLGVESKKLRVSNKAFSIPVRPQDAWQTPESQPTGGRVFGDVARTFGRRPNPATGRTGTSLSNMA